VTLGSFYLLSQFNCAVVLFIAHKPDKLFCDTDILVPRLHAILSSIIGLGVTIG